MSNFENIQNTNEFVVTQKMVSLANRYVISDANNNQLLFSKQKMLKLKEDIRFFFDEKTEQEAFRITTPSILDFSAKYEVIDSTTNQTIGYAKRDGMKSIIKGKWRLFDASNNEIAIVEEDSAFLAILRRTVDLITLLIPVKFVVTAGGAAVGEIRKKKTWIRDIYMVDLKADTNKLVDRRLALALAVLLDAINGQ